MANKFPSLEGQGWIKVSQRQHKHFFASNNKKQLQLNKNSKLNKKAYLCTKKIGLYFGQ